MKHFYFSPIMNKKPIICLDAGHGGHDSGALGPRGTRESDVALAVVLLMGKLLAPHATVVYTRRDDTFIPLAGRATISNDAAADAFISVHCNSGPPGQGDGFEVFTGPGQTVSDALAVDLFTAYASAFPHKRKRMDLSDADEDKEANFTVLVRTQAGAALFELEFIHTPTGEAWCVSADNQSKAADALVYGIMKHFGIGAYAAEPVPVPALNAETIKGRIQAKAREIGELIGMLPA